MSDTKRKNNLKRAVKLLSLVVASILCIFLLTVAALKIYLATPLSAPQLSRFVTSYLQQGFTVQKIQLSGGTLILKDVRLENPAGFSSENLLAADAVVVSPRWFELLLGRQRFRLISIEGGKLSLEKNGAGIWNFAQLRQRLAAPQPPARPSAGTFIKELRVKDGSVLVQGEGVRGISLQVFDLNSTGSRDAQVELAFEDAASNRYLLKGTARPGKEAGVKLSLTAASLSLQHLATLLKLENADRLKGAQGALQVDAGLSQGKLRTSGVFSFNRVQLPGARINHPVAGRLDFVADYNLQADTARLKGATLTVNELVQLHAEGYVSRVKNERDFTLDLEMEQVDLALLNTLMPEAAGNKLLFGGRLHCEALRLEGDAGQGLRSAAGTLHLEDGSLASGGELLVSGLSGSVGLLRKRGEVIARGSFATPRPNSQALVEALDLPFDLALSPQLKPLRGGTGALFAKVMGVPLTGRVNFDAAKADPLSAHLKVSDARLQALNPLLKRYDLQAVSGTASGTLELAGKGVQELRGSAKVQLSNLKGSRGADSWSVKTGAVTTQLLRRGGRLQAEGDARLVALALNGKSADARFGYRLLDRMVYLDGVQVDLAAARISFSRLSAQLPAQKQSARISSYPLLLDMEGGAFQQGELKLNNLSGRVRGSLAAEGAGKWLEGTADFSSGAVYWQGAGVEAPALRLVFSRSGARGELSGRFLGGKLVGHALFKPFQPKADMTFQLDVAGAWAAQAARLLPKGGGMRPTGGQLDLRMTGAYSPRTGLSCRFDSQGRGISLADGAGKALVSGAALSLEGGLAGGTLSIGDAMFSPGPGVTLKLKGEIAEALSPRRRGTVLFSLPETPLSDLLDALINMAPRMVQEATIDGRLAADGRFELREGRNLLEGGIDVRGGRMEVPSQKLVVADINGRLPFSLDLSGNDGAQPRPGREFSRENYQRLLAQLREDPTGGEVFTVGKIGFGTLETGKLTVRIRAENGLAEIVSLRTTLYEGTLLGTGYLAMREKIAYRGDILVNGLSLRTLCRTIPDLEGYISGRVDGVVSLRGVGGGIAGVTGFVDLWAREGSREKMLVSKEFLQRLAKQKLSGFFLSTDRPYDEAEIKATLEEGDLSFNSLKIVNRNLFGVRDLNVTIAPTQNTIALDHLLESVKEAAGRSPATGERPPAETPVKPEAEPGVPSEFKWDE